MNVQVLTSGLQKYGDMTSGAGLNAIFDDADNTSGYKTAPSGYAGVVLSQPTPFDIFKFVSQDNGFDASGALSQITLKAYGRQGSYSPLLSDHILLATLGPFTDINQQLTKDINIIDKAALYTQAAWQVISDYPSAYAALCAGKLFSPTPPPPPYDPGQPELSIENVVIRKKRVDVEFPLPKNEIEIPDSRINFYVDQPYVANLDFYANVAHSGNGSTGYNDVVGFGFWAYRRFSETYAGLATAVPEFLGGKTGDNIRERNPQHYGPVSSLDAVPMLPGYHQFFLKGASYTSAAGYQNTDGLAKFVIESGAGLNLLRVTAFKNAKLFNF